MRVAPVRPSKTVACAGPESATASGPGAADTNGPVTRATSANRNRASATDGHDRHVIPKASPKTHDDEVLAALGDLPAAA
jgi:hypothetical protein